VTAGNWVDRGEPSDAKVREIIAHFLGEPDAVSAAAPWLDEAVRDVTGMVIADAGEVPLAGYLRKLATTRGRTVMETPPARVVAIAIWHVVKVAEVRDRAARTIRAQSADRPPERPPLAEWLAERLLSPEELQVHRGERREG
jgi:hypothetical protein